MPLKLGGPELLIILAIIMIFFGAKRLPEIGGAMGKAVRSFRTGIAGEDDEVTSIDAKASEPK